MTRKILYLAAFAYFLVTFLIMFSCANQVAPTGGKKDVIPPKVLSALPPNNSVNFTGKKIIIKFDEFVKLDNVFSQVVVSPPLDKFPDLTLKGKSLVITFKEPLKPNSTYTINFGDCIKDITEGNVLKDFSFVFSTGAQLDSLKIGGMVLDAEKSMPVEDVLVMLYKDLSDSAVYKHKPYYFGRTNKSGIFTINHIQEGTYKLFALKDANYNLIYDQLSEAVAFWDDPITISGDSATKKNYRMVLFTEQSGKLRLTDAIGRDKMTNQYSYSAPINDLKITPIDTAKGMKGDIFEWNATKDTIIQWLTFSVINPKVIALANDTLKDTVSIKRPEFAIDSVKPNSKLTFTTSIKPFQGEQTQSLYKPFTTIFSRPIATIDTSKISLYNDTIWKNKMVVPITYIDSSVQRKVAVNGPWKADYWYSIYLQKGAFTDIYGKSKR